MRVFSMANSFCCSFVDDHLQRNNFHAPSTNNLELKIRTTYSSHGRSSSIPATTVPPQSSSPSLASFQFASPIDSIPKGQPSLERRNSTLTTSAMTPPKTPKQSRKRRRSSVEQTSPVVISSKSNDVLVSPIPVDGLKDMPQPFVSLTDMNFHGATAISPLHQPTANHQVQDIKNCLAFSGNAFDNEQLPTQPYNRDSHKTEDNLNSMINKVCKIKCMLSCIVCIFCRLSNSSRHLRYRCRSTSCLMAC